MECCKQQCKMGLCPLQYTMAAAVDLVCISQETRLQHILLLGVATWTWWLRWYLSQLVHMHLAEKVLVASTAAFQE